MLLAWALRERGYDVCVLDADSTNLGLHRALGLDQAPVPLLDYFGGMVFSGGRVTCPVDDPTPLAGAKIQVAQLPAKYYSRNDEGILFLAAGKIGDPGAGCDGPVAKIARDLTLEQNAEHPVTLIDFKAGFEDSARGAVTSVEVALQIANLRIEPRNIIRFAWWGAEEAGLLGAEHYVSTLSDAVDPCCADLCADDVVRQWDG